MLIAVLALVAGLAILAVAADWLVEGAAHLAYVLRWSTVVIGAVVIGFGTSAPELVVSVLAAAQGAVDIAVGNVIGSNVANLSLILGIAALITPIAISSPTLRREVPLATAAVVAYAVLLVPGRGLGAIEGAILALGLVAATIFIVRGARTSRSSDDVLAAETEAYIGDRPDRGDTRRALLLVVVGLAGTIAGAQAVVYGAREIATAVGLAEGFVGFTIVAIGTSLPELVTSIQAARRREVDLIVGNLLGSNLMNALLVGGFIGLVGPDRLTDPGLVYLPNAAMVTVALVAAVLMLTDRRVARWEGALLVAAYIALLPFLPR